MLNKNFSFIIALSNLLFYIGIVITICLCNLEENTPIFLIGYLNFPHPKGVLNLENSIL